MVPIVAGLALAMPFMALHFICFPATNALGKPQIYLATSIAGAIIMPIAFHDNNQLGPNENLRIGNLWYGVDLFGAVLTMGE